jgi:hypothetical protein
MNSEQKGEELKREEESKQKRRRKPEGRGKYVVRRLTTSME